VHRVLPELRVLREQLDFKEPKEYRVLRVLKAR
jgi:hypothetical protein